MTDRLFVSHGTSGLDKPGKSLQPGDIRPEHLSG
jgi:hypothetical protein